jgi:hypothetical protein
MRELRNKLLAAGVASDELLEPLWLKMPSVAGSPTPTTE